MDESENTPEYWLERFKSDGASIETMRDSLTFLPADGAQAIAARRFIDEAEQAEIDRHLALSHAEQRPTLEQQERHHREQLAESRRQSGRAVAVSWASLGVALLALVVSWLSWRSSQAQPTHTDPPPAIVLPAATPPASTPTTQAPALFVPPVAAPATPAPPATLKTP